jgi:SAM-dependent methyltransferase
LDIVHTDGSVLFARYESLAHSLWRAQELSLFRQYLGRIDAPVLDFGCGDGSFSAVLLEEVAWGADTDPAALEMAARTGIYRAMVSCVNNTIPLPSGSVRSVISNSVLEHVEGLDGVIAELARVIEPGGRLALTAPTPTYTDHLTKWFGAKAANEVNLQSSHRNLKSASEWIRCLSMHGLETEVMIEYQPDWMTFWYRMLRFCGPRGLGRIPGFQDMCWRLWLGTWVRMVRRSISGVRNGANVFILARKREPTGADQGRWGT